MKFTLEEYYNWLTSLKTGRQAYQVRIFIQNLSLRDFLNISRKFQYYCGKDGVSWLCVYSSTDSENARPVFIKTGKPGRPKKKVEGDKVPAHMHFIIIGTSDKSPRQTGLKLTKSINKYGYKKGFLTKKSQLHSLADGDHFFNDVAYDLTQSDNYRSGGDFDFKAYHETHR